MSEIVGLLVIILFAVAMYLVGYSHGEEDGHVKARVSETPEEDPRED